MLLINRCYVLRSRPRSRVTRADIELQTRPLGPILAGQARARTLYLSVDPAMRSWMDDVHTYVPPIALGDIIRAGGLSCVIESRRPDFCAGDLVFGFSGWQEYSMIGDNNYREFTKLPSGMPIPLATLLAVAGPAGMSAYFGVRKIAQPRPGDCMVVTAAAGAAGSIAGQIGSIFGAKVVGVTGNDAKCTWLTDSLGFHAAVNYKGNNWRTDLRNSCGRGVDILFDNTGSEVTSFLFTRLTPHARVVLNGMIACYNGQPQLQISLAPVLMKRVRVEGVLATDYANRFDDAVRQMVRWILEGRLQSRETVVEGIEHLSDVLDMLFDGGNTGKLLVLADPEAVREIEARRLTPTENAAL